MASIVRHKIRKDGYEIQRLSVEDIIIIMEIYKERDVNDLKEFVLRLIEE